MAILPLATGVLGGIAIAVAGYTGYWYVAAGQIESRIDAWASEQNAAGHNVTYDATRVRGFPLALNVSIDAPAMDASSAGWAFQADSLHANLTPWDFNEITLVPGQHTTIRTRDGKIWEEFGFGVSSGFARLSIDDDRIQALHVDFTDVAIDATWVEDVTRIARFQLNGLAPKFDGAGGVDTEVLRAALSMQGIRLPDGFGEEMGEQVEYIEVDASLFGTLPDGDTQTAAALWRDAGGVLEVNDLKVRWGPLGVESTGTLTLDQAMRPLAAMTADIIGYGDIIDALIMSNAIPLGDAFLAKVAFNMLAEEPEGGGPRALRGVPVTAQNGDLFVGPVEVAKLSPISF